MRSFLVKGFILFVFLSLFSGCRGGIENGRKSIIPMPFEKQKWKDFDSISSFKYRPRMARDLVNKNLLIGKTRSEVSEMFGKEENDDGKTVRYRTEEIFDSIDPIAIEFLTVTFDENDKVEKSEIEFYKTGDW